MKVLYCKECNHHNHTVILKNMGEVIYMSQRGHRKGKNNRRTMWCVKHNKKCVDVFNCVRE